MSIRKILHDAIATKLNQEENGIQWVDLWKGQVGNNDKKELQYPFPFPAGFISVKNTAWIDEVLDAKTGNVRIEVLIFFEKYGDTFEGATDKETSFEIIDTVDQVADQLHWIEDSPFKELTQIGDEDMTERYNRPAYKLIFETIVYKQVNQN